MAWYDSKLPLTDWQKKVAAKRGELEQAGYDAAQQLAQVRAEPRELKDPKPTTQPAERTTWTPPGWRGGGFGDPIGRLVELEAERGALPTTTQEQRPLATLPAMPPGAPEWQQAGEEQAEILGTGVFPVMAATHLPGWRSEGEEDDRPEWMQQLGDWLQYTAKQGISRLIAAWQKPEERGFPAQPTTWEQRFTTQMEEAKAGGGIGFGVSQETIDRLRTTNPKLAESMQANLERQQSFGATGRTLAGQAGQAWEMVTAEKPGARIAEQVAGLGFAALQEPAIGLEQATGAAAILARSESNGLPGEAWAALTNKTWSLAYKQLTEGGDVLGNALLQIANGEATAEEIAASNEVFGAELVGQMLADPLNFIDFWQAATKVKRAKHLSRAEQALATAAESSPELRRAVDQLTEALDLSGDLEVGALRAAAEAKGIEVEASVWNQIGDALKSPGELTALAKAERDSGELWHVLGGPLSDAGSGDEALEILTAWATEPERLTQFFGELPVSQRGRKAQVILGEVLEDAAKLPAVKAADYNPARFIAELEELALTRLKSAYGAKDPTGLLKFASAWKGVMSEFYLTAIYSPGYLIRNFGSDLTTMGVDGLVTFEHVDDIDNYLAALGDVRIKRLDTSGAGILEELTGIKQGESRLPGVLGKLSEKGQELVRYAEPGGRIPLGEEARYKRVVYKALKRFFGENAIRRTPRLPVEAVEFYGPKADDLIAKVAQQRNAGDIRKTVEDFIKATHPSDVIEPTKYVDQEILDAMSPELVEVVRRELAGLPKNADDSEINRLFNRVQELVEEDEAAKLKDMEALPTQPVTTDADEMGLADSVVDKLEEAIAEVDDPAQKAQLTERLEEVKKKVPEVEERLDTARAEMIDDVKAQPRSGALDIITEANRDVERMRDETRKFLNELRTKVTTDYQANPRAGRNLWPKYFFDVEAKWTELAEARIARYGEARDQLARLAGGEAIEDIIKTDPRKLAEYRLRVAGEVIDAPQGFMPGSVKIGEENEKFEAFLRAQRNGTDRARSNAWRAAYGSNEQSYGKVVDLLDGAERDVEVYGKATAGKVADLRKKAFEDADKAFAKHRGGDKGKWAAGMVWEKYYAQRNAAWKKYFDAAEKRWKIAERDVLMENFRSGPRMEAPAQVPREYQLAIEEGDEDLVKTAMLKPEEFWTPEETEAIKRWTATGRSVPQVEQPLLPVTQQRGPYTRDQFKGDLQRYFRLSEEEADAVQALADARAEVWSKYTGRPPEEWYTERLAGFGRGEDLKFSHYYQVGPGDPDAGVVLARAFENIAQRNEAEFMGTNPQQFEAAFWDYLQGADLPEGEAYYLDRVYIHEAAKNYCNMKASTILPEAKPGIQAEARAGHRIMYRTARSPEEVLSILDAAERGHIGSGFRPSLAHVKDRLRKLTEAAAGRGQRPVYMSNYPSVAAWYHDWKATTPITFAFEVPEEAILYTSARAAAEGGGGIAWSTYFCDTELIIDANQITRSWHIPDELVDSLKEWSEELSLSQTRKGMWANVFKDADPELAEAGAKAIADLREPPASLGRPFLEAPLEVGGRIAVQQGDRVALATGDVVKVQRYTEITPEQAARFYDPSTRALFGVTGYNGPTISGVLGRENIPDYLVLEVIPKGKRVTAADRAGYLARGRSRVVKHLQTKVDAFQVWVDEVAQEVADLEAAGKAPDDLEFRYGGGNPWRRLEGLQERQEELARAIEEWKIPTASELAVQRPLFQTGPTYMQMPLLDAMKPQERRIQRELVALHNMTAENLRFTDDMGGIAVPSIAITKKDVPFESFGEITLIGNRGLIDPEVNYAAQVFDTDIWSPRYPRPEWKKPRMATARETLERLRPASEVIDDWSSRDQIWDAMVNSKYPDRDKVLEVMDRYPGPKLTYMQEVGIEGADEITAVTRRKALSRRGYIFDNPEIYDFFAENIEEIRDAYRACTAGDKSPLRANKTYREFGALVRDALEDIHGLRGDKLPDRVVSQWYSQGAIDYWAMEQLLSDFDIITNPMKHQITDWNATEKLVNELFNAHDLARDYEDWAVSLADEIFGQPYVRVQGRLRPYTLDNVVEVMTRTRGVKAQEGSVFFSPSKARAAGGEKLSTIDKIREAAGKILPRKDVDAWVKEFQDPKVEALLERLSAKSTIPGKYKFGSGDHAMEAIADYLKKGYKNPNPAAMRTALEKWSRFTKLDDADIEAALEVAQLLREVPTPYFEAKLQRGVRLEEFVGAVVPDDVSEDVLEILERAGIEVERYDPKDIKARGEAVSRFYDRPDVLFQDEADEWVPMFYSKAERAIETKMPTRATPQQVKNILNKGIPKDELEFTGVMDWLDTKTEAVTKQEVLEYLDKYGIQVDETVVGDKALEIAQAEQRLSEAQSLKTIAIEELRYTLERRGMDRIDQIHMQKQLGYMYDNAISLEQATTTFAGVFEYAQRAIEMEPELCRTYVESLKQVESAADATRQARRAAETKYGEYTLARGRGATGYKEMLLTWGGRRREIDQLREEIVRLEELVQEITLSDPEYRRLMGQVEDINLQIGEGRYDDLREIQYEREGIEELLDERALQVAAKELLELSQARQRVTDWRRGRYYSGHWDDTPDILVHIRFDERYDPDGAKVLFIEEVQSDWHQAGRTQGYRDPGAETEIARLTLEQKQVDREMLEIRSKVEFHIQEEPPARYMELLEEYTRLNNEINELSKGVAKGPYSKSWDDLAIKRILRWASENDYAKVAWTTGQQQIERYDLRKIVDRLEWDPLHERLTGLKDGSIVTSRNIGADELPNYVGKDIAKKLTSAEQVDMRNWSHRVRPEHVTEHEWAERWISPSGSVQIGRRDDGTAVVYRRGKREEFATVEEAFDAATSDTVRAVEGEDLAIGGHGMETFYDRIMPYSAKGQVEKFGAKIEKMKVTVGTTTRASRDPFYEGLQVYERLDGRGFYVQAASGAQPAGQLFPTREAAELWIDDMGAELPDMAEVWGFTLTPEAKRSVLYEGQPLLQGKKGATQFLDDGRAIIHGFESGDVSTVIHELGHIFRRELTGAELAVVEGKRGIQNGRWSVADEEWFARAFERYLAEGSSPVEELNTIFARFKDWLVAVYGKIKGSKIDVEINDAVRGVFDNLLVDNPPTRDRDYSRISRGLAEDRAARIAADPDYLAKQEAEALEQRAWDNRAIDTGPDYRGRAKRSRIPIDIEDARKIYEVEADDWQELINYLEAAGDYHAELGMPERVDAMAHRWAHQAEPSWIDVGGKQVQTKRSASASAQREYRDSLRTADTWKQHYKEQRELSAYFYDLVGQATELSKGNEVARPTPPEWILQRALEEYEDHLHFLETGELAARGATSTPGPLLFQEGGEYRQRGMFEQGEDLPLFSGAAQRAAGQSFVPPTAGAQGALPGMEPSLGDVQKYAAAPVQTPEEAAKAAAELEALRPPRAPEGQGLLWQEGEELDTEAWLRYRQAQVERGATSGPNLVDIVQAGGRATREGLEQMREGILGEWGTWERQIPSEAVKRQVVEWAEKEAIPSWYTTRAVGLEYAQLEANKALLDYGSRRNFDTWLSYVVPYHFWFTRSGWNWAQRLAGRPGMLAGYIRYKDALKAMNQEAGRRRRFESKIPVPAPWLPEWMGGTLFVDPAKMVLPFASLYGTNWDDGDESRKGMQAIFGALGDVGFRPYHFWELPYQAGWIQRAGQAMGMEPQAAAEYLGPDIENNFGMMLPQTGAIKSATALAREMGVDALPPGGINIEAPLRRAIGLPAGEVWDPYRVKRMLSNMSGDDPANQELALAALRAIELVNRDPGQDQQVWTPESQVAQQTAAEMNWSPEQLAAAQAMLAEAMQRAQLERGIGTIGWALGPSMTVEPTGERAQLELADRARGQVWTPNTPQGSRAAYQGMKDQYPAMYARAAQYTAMPGDDTGTSMDPGVRANWIQQRQAKDQINADFDARVDEFLRQRPWDWKGRGAIEDERRAAIDQAKAQYPMPEFEGDIPPILYGMNPAEMWDSTVEDELYTLKDTKPDPATFDDGTGAIDWSAYYDAVDVWAEGLPPRFSFGPVQGGLYQGLAPADALREFDQRYDSPLEAANRTYQEEVASPAWDAYHATEDWKRTVGSVGPIAATALIPQILEKYTTKGWTAEQLAQELGGVIFPSIQEQLDEAEASQDKSGGYAASSAGGWRGYDPNSESYKEKAARVQAEGWRSVYGKPWFEKYPRRNWIANWDWDRGKKSWAESYVENKYPRWRGPQKIYGGPYRYS